MSSTIYTIHGFDFQIQDATIAEEFARHGHKVSARVEGGSE